MVSSDEINRRLEARRRGVKYQEPMRRTGRETATDSKECPSCHTQNPPTAKFCVGCGKKLETPLKEEGFSPEIKSPESEESAPIEKPIKSSVTRRPDDFSGSGSQKIKPSRTEVKPAESKKLKPIVLESPEPGETPEPETKSTEPETTSTPQPSTSEEKPKLDVDPVERIKKAKELLDMGALTQEEFDIIKKKYLDEI